MSAEYCSFCGKHRDEVLKLVEGPHVAICDECIGLAQTIVQEIRAEQDSK